MNRKRLERPRPKQGNSSLWTARRLTARSRAWLAAGSVVALAAIAAATDLWLSGTKAAPFTGPLVSAPSPLDEYWGRAPELPSRLVYPYSVVPGGVHSGDEARQASARDPVVSRHYEGFRFDRAIVVIVPETRLAYVSYRKNDMVYYTRKPVRLHKGERLLSDGKNLLRTRCGNRVEEAPKAPVSELEPPEEVMGAPELPQIAMAAPEYPAFAAPDVPADPEKLAAPTVIPPPEFTPLGTPEPGPPGPYVFPPSDPPPAPPPGPPPEPPPIPPVPPPVPPPGPPPEIPEPGTWALVGVGLATAAYYERRRRRNRSVEEARRVEN